MRQSWISYTIWVFIFTFRRDKMQAKYHDIVAFDDKSSFFLLCFKICIWFILLIFMYSLQPWQMTYLTTFVDIFGIYSIIIFDPFWILRPNWNLWFDISKLNALYSFFEPLFIAKLPKKCDSSVQVKDGKESDENKLKCFFVSTHFGLTVFSKYVWFVLRLMSP